MTQERRGAAALVGQQVRSFFVASFARKVESREAALSWEFERCHRMVQESKAERLYLSAPSDRRFC